MAIPSNSLFDIHQDRIQEIIGRVITTLLPDIDPVFRKMIVTSMGVKAPTDFGRDWELIRTYHGSLAGVIEGGGPRKDFPLYGDTNTTLGAKVYTQGLLQTYPDATKGANALPYQLSIPMRSMLANLMMTLGEINAPANSGFIGDLIAPKLVGFARYLAQVVALYWYVSQNQNYGLTRIAKANTDAGADKTYSFKQFDGTGDLRVMVVDLKQTNFAVSRFMVGMRVQLAKAAAADADGTQAVSTDLFKTASGVNTYVVTAVDHYAATIELMAEDGLELGSDAATATITDGSTVLSNYTGAVDIVMAGTYSSGQPHTRTGAAPTGANFFTGIAGFNSWHKSGATNKRVILGAESISDRAIDVTVHPEFRGFELDMGGKQLTEHTLIRILRRVHAARMQYGLGMDCLLASEGVWLAYEETKIGRETLDRGGALRSTRNEGTSDGDEMYDEGFAITANGKTYKGYTSSYIEAGTVYGLKKGGNNWKMYVPPTKGTARKGGPNIPSWVPIQFDAPDMTGTSSIRLPIWDTPSGGGKATVTTGVQHPASMRLQIAPDEIGGTMKLTNVAEDRVYPD